MVGESENDFRDYILPERKRMHAIDAENELVERINSALDIMVRYGQIDGAHHKAWVIDQAVRALIGDELYLGFIRFINEEDTYSWDEGITP